LRQHYFKKAWNVFDFIIVISSLIGKDLLYEDMYHSNVSWKRVASTSQSKPFYADLREIVHINENSILENDDV